MSLILLNQYLHFANLTTSQFWIGGKLYHLKKTLNFGEQMGSCPVLCKTSNHNLVVTCFPSREANLWESLTSFPGWEIALLAYPIQLGMFHFFQCWKQTYSQKAFQHNNLTKKKKDANILFFSGLLDDGNKETLNAKGQVNWEQVEPRCRALCFMTLFKYTIVVKV